MHVEELINIPDRLSALEAKLDALLQKLEATPTVDIIPISRASELTGISENTIKNAIRAGVIEKYKPVTAPQNGTTFISLEDLVNNFFVKV